MLDPERASWMVRLIRDDVGGAKTADMQRYMRHEAPPYKASGNVSQWTRTAIKDNLGHPALYGELPYSRYRCQERRDPHTGLTYQRRWTKTAEEQEEEPITTIPVPPLIHKDAQECLACPGCERDDRPSFADIQRAKGASCSTSTRLNEFARRGR